MNKIPFENGTLVTPAKLNEDNTITPAVYEGTTPLTAHNLNLLQDNVELEIQEKYNNLELNIKNEENLRIASDTTLQNQINSLANGSPLVANSISEMTDTSRIYVESTSGHWFYYDGTNWIDAGTYQATEVKEEEIYKSKTNFVGLEGNLFLPENLPITSNGLAISYDKTTGVLSYLGTTTANVKVKIAEFKAEEDGTYLFAITQILQTAGCVIDIYPHNDSSSTRITRVSYNLLTAQADLAANTYYDVYAVAANGFTFNEQIKLQIQKGTDNKGYFLPRYKFLTDNESFRNLKSGLLLGTSAEKFIVAEIQADDCKLKFKNTNFILLRKKFEKMNVTYILTLKDLEFSLASYNDTSILPGNYVLFLTPDGNLQKVNYINFNTETIDENSIFLGYYYIEKEKIIDYKFNFSVVTKNTTIKKYLSICGVSIDTYDGYIPSPNIKYYPANTLNNVNMTWWKKLLDKTKMNLLINNSWTGARATTTNNNNANHPEITNYKVASSGIHRCLNLDDGTNTPDFIIIGAFGLNDYNNSNIGEYNIGDSLPDKEVDLLDSTNYDIYKNIIENYETAMATIFFRVQQKYPNAKIFVMDSYNYYNNGKELTYNISTNHNINEYNKSLYKVADIFGVEVIKLSEAGIHSQNSRNLCVEGASANVALHPNDEGMNMIFREVYDHLKKYID